MATSFRKNIHYVFHLFILLLPFCWSRNHRILLQDEVRQTVELSKFGFLQNGILSVNFTDMVVQGKGQVIFGFSLEKTGSDGISPYMEQHSEKCIFMDHSFDNANQISLALINLDLRSKSIKINKYGKDFLNLTIDSTPALPELATSTAASSSSDLNPGNAPMPHSETSSSASSSSNVFGSSSSTASSSAATKSSSVSTSSSTTPKTTASSSSANAGESNSATSSSSAITKSSSVSTSSSTTLKTTASSSSANAGESNSATSSSSPSTKSSTSTASSSPAPKTSASESSLSNSAGESNSAPSSSAVESGSIPASTSTKQGTSTVSTTSSNQAASTTVAAAADNPESNESLHRRRRNADTKPMTLAKGEEKSLPLYSKKTNISNFKYSGNFVVKVKSKAEEGLYNLYFHNCPLPNAQSAPSVPVAIQIDIVEKNEDNYLSAGEEPLPLMFGVLSVIFFVTAVYWFRVLRRNREFTYKVHYMMFVLILLKSLDLMFQAVNFHFISKDGKPAESWEVLYYITHLLKGALLFTTIVLIGTGYFFVKHVLSDRDKKIFMIVIPLQILANTAQIVMESTEEASKQYTTWKELFILVDLLCCGAILFPVVWSIRHLQEGSQTDGKAALNLAKLKLFRHFYVMIVCYIYFTRIIVYLIKITVPFQYMWLDDFFNNAASFVFFVLTGYKFRPAPDNPYLHVPDEDTDDEVEMDEVVTNSGFTDGVTRLQPSSNGKRIFETA